MIHISKRQMAQVEYLISQSIQGNHILFEIEDLRRVFFRSYQKDAPIWTEEEAYSAEHHIERLIMQPSLAQKKAYLDQLDQGTYDRVVKTYFNIIENNIYDALEVQH